MRNHIVETRFGEVFCQEEGQGDPLLLLHQSGRSSRMFRDVLPLLGRSCRAISFDLPGFGRSAPMPEGTTISDLADLCCELLDVLDAAPAHVYGHHSGNKIATEMAVRAPSYLRKLILAGQSHSIIADQQARNEAIGKFTGPYSAIGQIEHVDLAAAASWAKVYRTFSGAWWHPQAMLNEAARNQARAEALDAIEGEVGAARLYAANTAYDLGAGYRSVAVETLVLEIVTPQEDAMIGRQGGDVAALIPGAVLAEIEAPDGDGVTLEGQAPDLAWKILDFLQR
ncbi:MAG: alpha/beta fold hydrolase [Pseudorhodobacter sp.]